MVQKASFEFIMNNNYLKVSPIPVQMVSDYYAIQNDQPGTKLDFTSFTKDFHFPREFELQKPGISASLSQYDKIKYTNEKLVLILENNCVSSNKHPVIWKLDSK